ncbi:MAG TPA: hypothetical protein VJT80_11730 [Steroidobacteraceae bacterium]|nr:hypothetical protein [Steroidobacteraceae bacterium]
MNAHSRVDRRTPLDVDSTQTMRALSQDELYDSHQQRWFALQLVISDRPINLEMMPRLESFASHQLYALAAKHETGTWHALRLGFFADEQSAAALCDHLRTYFSAATTVRVSSAEQTRFAQRMAAPAPVQKSAPVAAKPAAAVPAAPAQPIAQKPAKAASSQSTTPSTTPSTTKGKKTLAQELMEEARELQRGRSGKKKVPEQNSSWITRLFGQPKPRRA